MKKVLLTMLGLSLLVFALSGISYGWQGRMGGMGDPFGLVVDESDFLIHPAKIAREKANKFYGDYRFTYTGVTSWDINYNGLDFDASGQEDKHYALLGATLSMETGRLGLFVEYAGKRGNYDGNAADTIFDLKSKLDNFAVRFLYGLPVGSFNLGGEVQFAYRQEENKTRWHDASTLDFTNYFGFGNFLFSPNITPFMTPYESKYMEALFKGSLERKVGPLDLEFTLHGGFILGGKNEFDYTLFMPPGTFFESFSQDGNVRGWRVGGDLWLRYFLNDGLTLPFLVRIEYREKTRDGDGQGAGNLAGINIDYKHKEKPFKIEAGGGIDTELASSTRIAVGLYYNYLRDTNEIRLNRDDFVGAITFNHYPAGTEHRVLVRLVGEREISPAVTLRMGLNGFYGWAQEDYEYFNPVFVNENSSIDGFRWGVGASLGGTIKFKPITLEPFITGGYQSQDLSGESLNIRDHTLNEWSIGGGVSILYDF